MKINHHREKKRLDFLNQDIKFFMNRICSVGYFPQGYVLPPCFKGGINHLSSGEYYYKLNNNKLIGINKESITKLEGISTPKGELHERMFSVINPKMYYDIAKLIIDNKEEVAKIIFDNSSMIYSFSNQFIPNTSNKKIYKNSKTKVISKSGLSIGDFIKGEEYLLQHSYKYSFYLQTDIKSFYPSIYTHSIGRIINGVDNAKNNIGNMDLLGNRIDCLLQKSHNNETNGISTGSVLSDIIGELILSKVDSEVSNILKSKNIDFIGIRFKDDYKILTNSESNAKIILRELSQILGNYKLYINEQKTVFSSDLPSCIFRKRIFELDFLLDMYVDKNKNNNISKWNFQKFKIIYFKVLEIYNMYPNQSIFEKFLGKMIIYKKNNSKINFTFKNSNEIELFISLLIQIKNKRLQCLPVILSIFELLLKEYKDSYSYDIQDIIYEKVINIFENVTGDYELLRIGYFLKKHGWGHSKIDKKLKNNNNNLIKSLGFNKQKFFTDFDLFDSNYSSQGLLQDHISIFSYDMI